jgi:thiol-disulfide isomerase/thioredoxin
MRLRALVAPLALLTLSLAGCASSDHPATEVAAGAAAVSAGGAASAAGTAAASPGQTASAGRYIDYATYQSDPAAYANGAVVLFFHATWCPSCQATDKSLTTAGVPAGLTVVKVDYDSATDLKRKYGITQQHTFVAVNASGEQLKKWSGSPTGADILAQATG